MEQITRYIYRIDLDLTGLYNKTCSFCPRSNKSYPNVKAIMSLETKEAIRKFKETPIYRGHVAKIASQEGSKYAKELLGGNFIPVYQED